MDMAQDEIVVTASKRQAVREDLGDYKLYRTPEPVTVAPMQTKQIAFLSVPNVEADRVFAFSFSEAQEGNLAQPLPKGNFRVFTNRENGVPAYLGEDRVDNLAVDLPADIKVSNSIAVQMQSRIEGVTTGQAPRQIGLKQKSKSVSSSYVKMILAKPRIPMTQTKLSRHIQFP